MNKIHTNAMQKELNIAALNSFASHMQVKDF
nr:MAG TPA: hypothetical protein [Caudoviricetes sp.]